MRSTNTLRVLSLIGAGISLIGVALAVALGIGIASGEQAAPWHVAATSGTIAVGVVLTIYAAVSLGRRSPTS